MSYAMIQFARWHDGLRFPLTIAREERRFMECSPPIKPFARVEQWTICARDRQEALRTIEYHFGRSLLSFTLGEPEPSSAKSAVNGLGNSHSAGVTGEQT